MLETVGGREELKGNADLGRSHDAVAVHHHGRNFETVMRASGVWGACVRKQEAATIDLTPVCPCEVVKRVLALNAADRFQYTGGHSKRPTPPTPDASRSSRTPATMALQKRCGRHEPFGSMTLC